MNTCPHYHRRKQGTAGQDWEWAAAVMVLAMAETQEALEVMAAMARLAAAVVYRAGTDLAAQTGAPRAVVLSHR